MNTMLSAATISEPEAIPASLRDQQTVAAVREGDLTRYRELVERYQRQVYAVAWSRLGDATLAEEATQEAFIRAFRSLPLLGDAEKFPAWISAIARNLSISLGLRHRRELNKRARWALEQPISEAPASADEPTGRSEMLRQALAELSATHRECLVLFYLEDKSGAEAAALLGIAEATLRVRLMRARAALREKLEARLGCRFCASGLAGWKRDLAAGEIVAQLLHVCRQEDPATPRAREELASFDNIVVMGMGEPLANYDNLLRALTIVNADWGLRFGARRITISTSGLAPQIRQLADEDLGFRLAISLHGATDEVRSQIMPINRKYPLAELLPAIEAFSQKHGRMVTLEFILIADLNDTLEQARALAPIARQLHAHVNLIPYNTVEGLPWLRPTLQKQEAFADILRRADVSTTLRREKGHDIAAACGQLRLQTEDARASAKARQISASVGAPA